MANVIETRVRREYKRLGWRPFRNGWPDFLMARDTPDGIELLAVEAKSKANGLSLDQWVLLTKLATVIRVVVVKEHADGTLHEHTFDPQRGMYGR
jgi:hypothetical protein